MKTSVIYMTAVLTLLGLTVSRPVESTGGSKVESNPKKFNLSENKDFLIAQSGRVYRCINRSNETYIVPAMTGAYVQGSVCFIPVKSGRCMEKTVFHKAFGPCGKSPGDRRYYQIGAFGGETPFIIY
jgi:hypothetical protein